jgi:hypothetical protein
LQKPKIEWFRFKGKYLDVGVSSLCKQASRITDVRADIENVASAKKTRPAPGKGSEWILKVTLVQKI